MRHDSKSSIELLQLSPADWALWRSLRLRALEDAPNAFSSKLSDWQGQGDHESRWRDRLTKVPFNLVSYLDRSEAGMASATAPADGEVELISMWVAPFARGRGVGDALVAAVSSWATDKQACRITLKVFDHNRPAIGLYRRQGFTDYGTIGVTSSACPVERKMILELKSSSQNFVDRR